MIQYDTKMIHILYTYIYNFFYFEQFVLEWYSTSVLCRSNLL